jgi:hypothetical protein
MVFKHDFQQHFNYKNVYRGGQFYWWRKPEQSDKLNHILFKVVSGTPHHEQDSNSQRY